MAFELLDDNVEERTITPFLELELLPDGHPDWGLVTNNNFIRVENETQSLAEEIAVLRRAIDEVRNGLDGELQIFRGELQNEAIQRSAADAALQAQIPSGFVGMVRFSGRTMTAGAATLFNHDLGRFPQVTVIREVGGSGGVDVSNAYDTVVAHNNPNQISVTVGISGTYTIICVA